MRTLACLRNIRFVSCFFFVILQCLPKATTSTHIRFKLRSELPSPCSDWLSTIRDLYCRTCTQFYRPATIESYRLDHSGIIGVGQNLTDYNTCMLLLFGSRDPGSIPLIYYFQGKNSRVCYRLLLINSQVKHTTQSLYAYLNTLHSDKEMLKSICDTVIKVFADNLHVKRITGPIFNFLDRLLSSGKI